MALLIGTTAGVLRAPDGDVGAAQRTLDAEGVFRVRTFEATEGVFAASEDGLFRSTDHGETWTDLGVPAEAVTAVLADPTGERLYAGTRPPAVYVSEDGGQSWRESEGFARLPKDDWRNLGKLDRGPDGVQVRSLAADPRAPDRIVAGVESVGVFVGGVDGRSPTARGTESHGVRGETWVERAEGLHADVHHVLALDAETYVAACGRGLYRTRDAGRTWVKLDTDHDLFWYTYYREAFVRDGVLYAGAQDRSEARHRDEASATVVESGDEGRTLELAAHPGDDSEFAAAWTAVDGRVVAGTSGGRVIVRDDSEGWQTVGTVPGKVRALEGI